MRLQLHGWYKNDGTGIAVSSEDKLVALKEIRQALLTESDWMMLPDCQMPKEILDKWILWRQYMRDLPSLIELPLENTLVIEDPPEEYLPKTWANLDLDQGANPYGIEQI
jgi:hypothetical protein